MAIGETFDARIGRIAAGGAGIARLRGKCVFVALTAPGDLVRCRITGEHKKWARAEPLEILEPSPRRVAPECPLYGSCGGCSLQHLDYGSQTEAKTGVLRDAFARIGGKAQVDIRVRESAPFGYRNRVQFHRAEGEGSPVGFMGRKSSQAIALKDCPVADAGIRAALKEGRLKAPEGRDRFCVYSKGDCFLSEGGTETGRVSILGKKLLIGAGVFFQSNAAMLELLVRDLAEAASTARRDLPLADIYCGVGTFAFFLGGDAGGNPGFAGIELVEENPRALALARENMQGDASGARGDRVNYCSLTDTAWAKAQGKRGSAWGFAVLDPPREGLSRPLTEYLAAEGPGLMAYVSCDPATLARDSRAFFKGGYTLKELYLYDFYPQTAHIESLAVFSREGKSGE